MGLNKLQRDYWYPKVVYHFLSESCNGCGVKPFPSFAKVLPELPILISKLKLNYWVNTSHGKRLCTILYLDHINNDDSLNVIENFQLLCTSCNVIKNPKNFHQIQIRDKAPEMKRGDKQEPRFRTFVHDEIVENDWVLFDDLINAGAEYLTDFDIGDTLSTETAKRYLGKMLSKNGLYAERNGYVTFKYKLPLLDERIEEAKKRKEDSIKNRKKLTDTYD